MVDGDIKERIYRLSDMEFTSEVESELKVLLEPFSQGAIGIVQINPKSCDIKYNSQKIIKYIEYAQKIGLELVIFPELIIAGAPFGDAIFKYPIFVENNLRCLKEIAKIATKITAIVGFIEFDEIEKKYYSSFGVLQDATIKDVVRKCEIHSVLNNNSCNNFYKTIVINGKKYGFINDFTSDLSVNNCPDIFINCCTSAFDIKYEDSRNSKLSELSKKYSIPMVYVNQVGATDGMSFCGLSRVYDSQGKILACADFCKEQLLIVNPYKNLGKIYPKSENIMFSTVKDEFSLNYEDELERTYKTIIQGIKDYFEKTGFKRAVLGLSGGLDSTVCAVLLADALGSENVCGISMPSVITSEESMSDARILAKNLGINFVQAPIKEMVDVTSSSLDCLFRNIENSWNCRFEKSYTNDNIQARSRAMIVWGVSNEFESCLPIATSDKSEAYMGYATINGDMSGGFAPIADVTKTKLFALARWLNKYGKFNDAIPESVILKRPGAELAIDPNTGKPLAAEDALMPYEFMDEAIWRFEYKNQGFSEMLESEFLYEKSHVISKEQKIKWLEKFYKRMAGALYKKSILPPYVIVDSVSISSMNQPITSGGINFKSECEDDIKKFWHKR